MIAPQPVREASVVSVTRRQRAPSTGPWDRKQGSLHMTRARRQRRVTLIVRRGFPLGENPLVLSHHCNGLMYNRPQGITLDAAAIRPSSLWNCFTVSNWPSFTRFTAERIEVMRAGDRHARIATESHNTPRKDVFCDGDRTLFLAFSLNPSFFMCARTTSRCRTAYCCD